MKRLVPLILTIMLAACAASGKVYRGYVSNSSGEVTFAVDSIDCRPGLTRVYGSLSGTPHTSGRIDSITMTVNGKKNYSCTDIDGIDFKRYYQFEDNGRISLELDFPPMKNPGRISLTFTGSQGESVVTVTRK